MNTALRLAIKKAYASEHTFKVGAVIFKGGQILNSSCNKNKTNPIRVPHKSCINKLHAEMAAIRNCNTEGASILVIRLDKRDYSLTMAKPCPDCEFFIREAGIKKIVYSDFDGKLISERV